MRAHPNLFNFPNAPTKLSSININLDKKGKIITQIDHKSTKRSVNISFEPPTEIQV